MSDMARLLNLAARAITFGDGEPGIALVAGTVRVPLRVVGYDQARNEVWLEMDQETKPQRAIGG
jgi:hypothetical protein